MGYKINLVTCVIRMQRNIPMIVGSIKANNVHFKLPVSFFMVISVVEHGQCISVKIIIFTAVNQFQPFCTKSSFISKMFSNSVRLPWDIYDIIIIGITVSLAGKPNINAIIMTPSRPNNRP